MRYPPFCDLILLEFSSENKAKLKKVICEIHKFLKNKTEIEKHKIILYSPTPSAIEKIKNRYRWKILIKCILEDKIKGLLNEAEQEFLKKKLKEIRMIIKKNPNNLL